MTLDPQLLAILVCPEDKGPLHPFEDGLEGSPPFLYNPRLRRRYAVVDGIPNMLPDEAEQVDDATHATIMGAVESGGIRPTGS
jgi:uncharacterized protein